MAHGQTPKSTPDQMPRSTPFKDLRDRLKSLDRRQRKYLTTKAILSVRSILPAKFRRKMERRLQKYGPNSGQAEIGDRLIENTRISTLAREMRRLAAEGSE